MNQNICKSKTLQISGLKRNKIDKFYTKLKTTEFCMNYILNNLDINKSDDLIIEPSAGNGSFISIIKKNFRNYKFYDLYPENDEIIKLDYLKLNYQNLEYPKIHIIGNPPFGRQSSTALKFIKFSAKFCDSISFILPKSFKKTSMQEKIPLNFHLKFEIDIPDNSFLLNNKDYNVPCVFQIWIKKNIKREKLKREKPKKFKFVKKNESHHISFRRVGVYAGNISLNTDDKSVQTHYFIKFDKEPEEELIEKLKKINFNDKDNTVGARSISKLELTKEFNMIL